MMNDKERIKQEITKEITENLGVALALIVGGIAREIGPEKLLISLRANLDQARTRPKIPENAIEIASYAVVYLEAQCRNNQRDEDGGQHKH
jgi:hypothetical protein